MAVDAMSLSRQGPITHVPLVLAFTVQPLHFADSHEKGGPDEMLSRFFLPTLLEILLQQAHF